MKTIKFFALLAAVLSFAACEKENKDSDTHERDIVYTVDEDRHDAHLTTDAEFDTLLEEFCDFAQEGSTVTFYNALKAQKAMLNSKGATKEVTYRTTSREEIKRWMRQMENEGRTVTVTYDRQHGTWNGIAYATAPPEPDIISQWDFVQCYQILDYPDEDTLREHLITDYALFGGLTFFDNQTLQVYTMGLEAVYPPMYWCELFPIHWSANEDTLWLERTGGEPLCWQIIEHSDSSLVFRYRDSIESRSGMIYDDGLYTYRKH